MEVTADRDRVAGLPDLTDALTRVDALTAMDQGRSRHVSVEVRAVLAFAVDQEIVAIEDGVITGSQHPAIADRHQWRIAGGDDVEALVGATSVARNAELANRAAGAVRALDGEDVAVVGETTVGRCEKVGGGRCGKGREKEKR
jgi:hypothetical protein